MNASEKANHSLNLENRSRLFITGALELETFEEKNMTIKTTMGLVYLKGENMHIIKFDTDAGEILIEGEFNGFEYAEGGGKGSFFSRLFG